MRFFIGANVAEGLLFTLFRKHGEEQLQEIGGGGMDGASVLATHKIFERMAVLIVFPLINLARRNAVAEHLYDITKGHFDRLIALGDGIYIHPIFKMVLVSSLVMHPRGGIAEQLTLALVGAAVALIVFCARKELRGHIFGKIVSKPLPADPATKAVIDHLMAVLGNGA